MENNFFLFSSRKQQSNAVFFSFISLSTLLATYLE